ncbi:hypothetical protein NEMBOFW57_007897 [Staphylotrichum longicolle]|uniref:Tse2 ADP-ribosyltransferase toxin domain-containing protein n=1 Tax=Staphylotrichum longicolle TaxID=669026 RepID=A0AAD4EVZ4_9PEZI|nr:hypothetical protein NEMBOFW57_007897 [Staphylotrichum longicolle]
MPRPNLISIFNKFPKELFRVNNGPSVRLRTQRPHKYQHDVVPHNGLVLPKALDPASYSAPNGASMRPNSKYQQSLVRWGFYGDDVIVYAVAEELDTKITRFFRTNAKLFTKAQWIKAYPKATEKSYF